MGLANLVPGISGGTMLLATGVYQHFVAAVAELATLRFRIQTIAVLGSILLGAGVAVIAAAGIAEHLVVHYQWVMYSLFIGLTLGGAPLLLTMIKPLEKTAVMWGIAGFAAMAVLTWAQMGGSTAEPISSSWIMLFIAGIAAGAAMVLPGVSGSYLLLVLGQYLAMVAGIRAIRDAISDWSFDGILATMPVILPIGVGIVIGVVVVSVVVKFLLDRCRAATLGFLLGLLLGAVLGLWPFRAGIEPEVGDVIRGERIGTTEQASEIDPAHWNTATFTPSMTQGGVSLVLVLGGLAISLAIGRLGRNPSDEQAPREC
jgi:putative membrane protein